MAEIFSYFLALEKSNLSYQNTMTKAPQSISDDHISYGHISE